MAKGALWSPTHWLYVIRSWMLYCQRPPGAEPPKHCFVLKSPQHLDASSNITELLSAQIHYMHTIYTDDDGG